MNRIRSTFILSIVTVTVLIATGCGKDPELEVRNELIDELLENANWAPTHGFTEPWRFKIFSEDHRKVLGEKLQELYSKHTPDDQFRQDKMDGYGTYTYPDGRSYKGEWKNGKQDGEGVFKTPNNESKRGIW